MPKFLDEGMLPHQFPIPEGVLPIWVIYEHPDDHPDLYVLRPHLVKPPGDVEVSTTAWTHPNVQVLRALLLNMGLTRIPRHEDDKPAILETWL